MNTPKAEIEKVLRNLYPSRVIFAPNYWQWFAHHQNHDLLPDEIKHCQTQFDMIKALGLDVFSRNVYSNQDEFYFGGICEEYFDGAEVNISQEILNNDKITYKKYHLKSGELSESLLYLFKESTIIQKEFLIKNYSEQTKIFEEFVTGRKWKFNKNKYDSVVQTIGDHGFIILGEFFSPLKMLHFALGPTNSVYFILEKPDCARAILDIHEKAQLDLVKQCVESGVRVIMSMDNLDTMFHPPDFVEQYSASFYEKASALCHENGAKFFIHACGNQKDNLKLISSYKVDGLEGVAYPPLGDIELDEVMKMTPDNFIITGGISAMETRDLKSKAEIFNYVKNLFTKLNQYKNRFIFSASCNTSINTSFETIRHFRDAWLEYKEI